MTPKIKQRIEQLCRSEIPEGYKKTKAGILPVDWDVHMLGECLSRVERPVEVKPNELYTQIGIRSHGKGIFYKEPGLLYSEYCFRMGTGNRKDHTI